MPENKGLSVIPLPNGGRVPKKGRPKQPCSWPTFEELVLKPRWEALRFWFSQRNVPSLRFIASAMGMPTRNSLLMFVNTYGLYLASKYGNLPRLVRHGSNKLTAPIWEKIME